MYLLPGNAVNRSAHVNGGLKFFGMVLPNRLGGGGTKYRDWAGIKHGTFTGSSISYSGDHPPGGYGSISVNNSYVAIPRVMTAVSQFRISFWLQTPSTPSSDQAVAGKWDNGTGTKQWLIRWNSGLQCFMRKSDNLTEANVTLTTLATPGWNFITFAGDGSTVTATLNGSKEVVSASLAGPYIPTDTDDWEIGRGRTTSGGGIWKIDQFAIGSLAVNRDAVYEDSINGLLGRLNWQSRPVCGAQQAAGTFNPAWAVNSNAYIHLGA